jgi:hypothetical protein
VPRQAPRRFVAEIAEVTDVTETGAVAMNRIFTATPGSGDPRAVFRMAPQRRWPFDEAGVDLDFLTAPDPSDPPTATSTPRRPVGVLADRGRSRWV